MGTILATPNQYTNKVKEQTSLTVPSMKEKYTDSPFLKNIPNINR